MIPWLRLALAVQLLFFGAWAAQLMTSHREGTIVWLATEPVDPRDLLSGHYVALRYRIATAGTAQCGLVDRDASPRMLFIQLATVGEAVETAEGTAIVADAVGCQTFSPTPAPGEIWIAGRFDPAGGGMSYGIERMFVGEDNPLREARSGTVVAKVAINERFEPRLLGVVTKTDPTVVPVPETP